MVRALAALVATVTIAAVSVGGGTAAAPRFTMNKGQQSTSSNWSGYALEDATGAGLQWTSVTGTWKQPKTTCSSDTNESAAFWVGLGGEGDASTGLEQTGTGVDCSSGKPRYYAWYEILPAAAVEVSLKVRPGDLITTSVNVDGTSTLFQIKNRTRKTSFTKSLFVAAPDLSSAEWIAEAPSSCDGLNRCRVLPLANFGTVTFTRAATIASTHPGTINDPTWANVPITLVPDGGGQFSRFNMSTAGASPGSLSSDGRSFPVTWVSNATA